MDLLFAADSPWTWEAEKTYKRLKEETVIASNAARMADKCDVEAAFHVE